MLILLELSVENHGMYKPAFREVVVLQSLTYTEAVKADK